MDRIISPQILRLIKDRKSKEEILKLTNLSEDQLHSDIETLIQTGQPVLKTDLAYMAHIDFKVFSQLIGDTTADITAGMIADIQTKYFVATSEQVDSSFVRLGLIYHAVRFHLNRLDVPYVNCEDNMLVHAEKLIVPERQDTLNTNFQTDRQYPPVGRHHYNRVSFVDLFFGDLFSSPYDESDFEYPMDEDEFYESYDYEESNGGTDDEGEGVTDEEHDGGTDEERDEGTDDEGEGATDEERDVGADEEGERDVVESVEDGIIEVEVDEHQEESATNQSEDDTDSDHKNERGIFTWKRRRI